MAYRLTTSLTPRSNTNAEFRAWGSAISAAIANCGLVKLPDANVGAQINWSTVSRPTANQTSQGYEIWRYDDSMQATTPVYFKLEYGSGSTAQTPAMWVTWGSGANGSGNVTGNTTTRQQLAGTAGGTARNTYISGDNNRLIISFCAGGTASEHILIAQERLLNSNGTVNADGIFVAMWGSTSTKYQVVWTPTLGNVTAWEGTYGTLTPTIDTLTGQYGGQPGNHLSTYPVFGNIGAVWYPPQTCLMTYFANDYTTGVSVPIPLYGSNIEFLPLGNTVLSGAAFRGGTRTTFMMRWSS